ncbi:protein LDOC1L, partial [Tachysurus ichikawai]
MDSYDSASLQKTSPPSDPAGVFQLAIQLSAQVQQLAGHDQQLTRLTSLTGELAATLQGLRGTATALNPPPPAPLPPANPIATPAVTSPRLVFPEKFNGDPGKCGGFLMQCSLFVAQQPSLYLRAASHVAFVCTLLTGKVLEWATVVWREDGSAFPTFEHFLSQFRRSLSR